MQNMQKQKNCEKPLLTQRVIQVSLQVKGPASLKRYRFWCVPVEFWNFRNKKLILKVLPTHRKELAETSDFSSARLQSGKEEVMLLIAQLARLEGN